MMNVVFTKDYRSWKRGQMYELGGGVAGVLIERSIATEQKDSLSMALAPSPQPRKPGRRRKVGVE